jgi:hypothetical protein
MMREEPLSVIKQADHEYSVSDRLFSEAFLKDMYGKERISLWPDLTDLRAER